MEKASLVFFPFQRQLLFQSEDFCCRDRHIPHNNPPGISGSFIYPEIHIGKLKMVSLKTRLGSTSTPSTCDSFLAKWLAKDGLFGVSCSLREKMPAFHSAFTSSMFQSRFPPFSPFFGRLMPDFQEPPPQEPPPPVHVRVLFLEPRESKQEGSLHPLRDYKSLFGLSPAQFHRLSLK